MRRSKSRVLKSGKLKGTKIQQDRLVRNNRFSIVINDKEKEALDAYCKKYNIENKAQFIR